MAETESPPEEPPVEPSEPQRRLSDEEKATVRDVLKREDVNYNISVAAKLLGISYGLVESYVRRDPWLSAQCPGKNASLLVPGENDIVNRTPLPDPTLVTLTASEFDQYQAFIKQNRKMLAKDWEALGLDAKRAERMEGYVRLGSAPIGHVIRGSHGQLIKNMAMLDEIVEMDGKMIIEGKIPEEFKADGTPRDPEAVEREWRHTLFAGMKLQLDMFTHMNRVQAMMARALRDMQEALTKGRTPKKGKLAASAVHPPALAESENAQAEQ